MQICCVEGCPSLPNCSYFELPTEEGQYRFWCDVLKKHSLPGNLKPNKSPRVCELHFTLENFEENHEKKTLKPDAVPSIFKEAIAETPSDDADAYYQQSNSIAFENLLKRLDEHQYSVLRNDDPPPANCRSVGVQAEFATNVETLAIEKTILMERLTHLGTRKRQVEEEVKRTTGLLTQSEAVASVIDDIVADAAKDNEDAASLLDQIINYGAANKMVWNFDTNQPEEKIV